MQIILDIPDLIAAQMADSPETLIRRSLELLATEAYRKGLIGASEVGQLLGFTSRWETYDFLQREQAEPLYDGEELDDTPITEIREGLYQGWQDVLAGRTQPVSQLWEGMDVE